MDQRERDQPVPIDRAAEAVGEFLRARGRAEFRIVGVTGPVGAGKSTLARLLSPTIISTDDYFPDYSLVPAHLRDLPESSDLSRLATDLAALRRGERAEIPVWSFHTHKRESYRWIEPAALIVVEGLHALHGTIHPVLDARIYVDASRESRWARVRAREESGERGWGVEFAREFFETVAEPTFHARSAAYKASADIVVGND